MGPCVLSTDGKDGRAEMAWGKVLQWDRAFSARMAHRHPDPRGRDHCFNGTVRSQHGWRFGSNSPLRAILASMGPCVLSTDGINPAAWFQSARELQWDRAFSARMARSRSW